MKSSQSAQALVRSPEIPRDLVVAYRTAEYLPANLMTPMALDLGMLEALAGHHAGLARAALPGLAT